MSEVQTKRLAPKKGPITREPRTSTTITSAPQTSEVRKRNPRKAREWGWGGVAETMT
jgi:hypothetical protein